MTENQQTIAADIAYQGIGLHSGVAVNMVLRPAPVDTGIVFVRSDLKDKPSVKAHISKVTNTMRATTLEEGDAKVFTVEHILSALYALQIDNCYVEMDAAEPPVADGSGDVFAQLILQAGIVKQKAPRRIFEVKKAHAIYAADKYIAILPYDGFRITFTSINRHPMLGTQIADYEITPENYLQNIARARTIGFMHEIEALKAMGLAKGGSLENCIVYDDEKCLSELRFDDELVRHKILDVLGDVSLLGPIKGHIIALKSSHELNAQLSRAIYEEMKEACKCN